MPSHLFSIEIITVMHVSMLAQVRGYLTDFGVKLHVNVLLLAEENGMLYTAHKFTLFQWNISVSFKLMYMCKGDAVP